MFMLGNLQLTDIVEKEYQDQVAKCFEDVGLKHQSNTSVNDDEYHIFDIPKAILIGNEAKAELLVKTLIEKGLADKFKYQIEIVVKG